MKEGRVNNLNSWSNMEKRITRSQTKKRRGKMKEKIERDQQIQGLAATHL